MKLKILYWAPRILAILTGLFLIVFSFDSFGGDNPLGKELLGFLMHNIPVLLLIIILVIAWKFEIVGGALFILLFVALGIFFKSFSGDPASLIIISPILIAGVMFILNDMQISRTRQ
jgi:hypothetical protein